MIELLILIVLVAIFFPVIKGFAFLILVLGLVLLLANNNRRL